MLSESYPMNTNMTGLRRFSKRLCVLVLWTKVTSALEGLKISLMDKGKYQNFLDVQFNTTIKNVNSI